MDFEFVAWRRARAHAITNARMRMHVWCGVGCEDEERDSGLGEERGWAVWEAAAGKEEGGNSDQRERVREIERWGRGGAGRGRAG